MDAGETDVDAEPTFTSSASYDKLGPRGVPTLVVSRPGVCGSGGQVRLLAAVAVLALILAIVALAVAAAGGGSGRDCTCTETSASASSQAEHAQLLAEVCSRQQYWNFSSNSGSIHLFQ